MIIAKDSKVRLISEDFENKASGQSEKDLIGRDLMP